MDLPFAFDMLSDTVTKTVEKTLISETDSIKMTLKEIALTSRISQLATMDALFTTYFTLNKDECMKKLEVTSENINSL